MKVIEHSNSRLAFRLDPFGQIILGIIFFLAGLAVTFFFSRSSNIACQRVEARSIACTIGEKVLGIVPVGQRTVEQIQGAEVREHRDSDGDRTYRVVFLTPQGEIPMFTYWSSGYNSKAAVAEKMNTFIGNTGQNEISFTQPAEWFTMLFLPIFSGAGLLMVLTSKVTTVDLDRSKMTLSIEKDGLTGVRVSEYPLNEVEDAFVDTHRTSKGGHTYQVVLRMSSGENVPLSSVYSSGRQDKERTANAIREFLNLHKDGIIQEENHTLRFG